MDAEPSRELNVKVKKSRNYEYFQLAHIVDDFDLSRFRDIGYWIVHYDLDNFNVHWERAKEVYSKRLLDGVFKLGHKINICESDESKPILFFMSPVHNEDLIVKGGHDIVKHMEHKRQKCNATFEPNIYFKRALNRNSRSIYQVSYE
jgi:hypothetical protein